MVGLLLGASPQIYLKAQKIVPWVGILRRPPGVIEDSEEWRRWSRRVRLIGLLLVLVGAGLLSAVHHGVVPVRSRPFHMP